MKKSKGRIVFEVINVIVLSLLSFACLFPLLNILAMSFSSSTAVAAGKVSIFPVEFTASLGGACRNRTSIKYDFNNYACVPTVKGIDFISHENCVCMDFLLYNAVFRWPDSGLFANSESENDGYDLGVGASSSSSCLQRNFDVKFL